MRKRTRPTVWRGPEHDGITFSLFSRWLVDPERFRILVVDGLKDAEDAFNHRIEYGNLWHYLEESSRGGAPNLFAQHVAELRSEHPRDEASIALYAALCKHQFQIYQDYWTRQMPNLKTKELLQEESFKVPYRLPSGRVVLLRGKVDSVFSCQRKVFLQENKTKGEIDEEGISKTLPWNLQTMWYILSLQRLLKDPPTGVLYNVVRRPLADRFAPKRRTTESVRDFVQRVCYGTDPRNKNQKSNSQAYPIAVYPSHWFKRYQMDITQEQIEQFKLQCFHPLMERFCDWWEWISVNPKEPFGPATAQADAIVNQYHYRMPWGVYNSLAGGFRGDYFNLLTSGSTRGLTKVTTLFPEL